MKNLIIKNKIIIITTLVVLVIATVILSTGRKDLSDDAISVTVGDFVKEVSVSGKVVAQHDVDLAFNQSGRVSSVFAKVGDQVKQGQILASVENGDVYANVLQKQANLEAAQAKLTDLKNGARPEEITVAKQGVVSAQTELTQRTKGLADATKSSYANADDALRRYADQLFTNPRTISATFKYSVDANLKSEVEVKRYELEQMMLSWNSQISGTISKEMVLGYADDAVSNLEDIRLFLDKMSMAVNSIIASSNLSQNTLDGFKSDIAIARTNINTAISSITNSETLYRSAESTLNTANGNLVLLEAGATLEQIRAQEATVKSEEANLASAQAAYRKTLITAPFDGTITRMDAEVGGQASIANPEISIISNGKFIIEGFIPEINISSVSIGNTAVITLDAYGEDVLFNATVTSIDPAETIKDGVSTYKVKLEFNESDDRIRSGMTANVLITTIKKTNVVQIPEGLIFKESGRSYVLKLENGKEIRVEVQAGDVSSNGNIEIISGLSSGDKVIVKGQ